MQNLSKWYSRHLFLSQRFISSPINNGPRAGTNLNKQIWKIWTTPDPHKHFYPLSYNAIHRIIRECRAVCSLLSQNQSHQRKYLDEIIRKLHMSTQNNKNQSSGSSSSNDQSSQSNQKSSGNKNGNEQYAAMVKLIIVLISIYSALIFAMQRSTYAIEDSLFISWNEFVHQMLAKGEVQELIVKPEIDWVTIVLHDGAIINGKRVGFPHFQMIVADGTRLEEKLREAEHALGIKAGHGVPISYERRSDLVSLLVSTGFALWTLFSMSRPGKKNSIFSRDLFGGITRAKFTLVDPLTGGGRGVKFNDVAGLKEAKIEIMEFVDYLKRPERYKTLGAKVPRGALLLGPPGCGKTMLAKAVATEASVPFLSMNGSEFIEMIGGLGAARVRDLFKEARKRSPSILYIDEIDAIGKQRSGSGGGANGTAGGISSESEQTLNQLLVEMDGMASRDGVIILASTNRAEVLDKALLRPGRFDRHILIDLPTLPERKEIFEQHLRGIVLEKKPENYSARLAQLTPGFSGADIANVCNEAALHAARVKKKRVDATDLSYAIDRVLCGPEKKSHGVSPSEKRIVAYHEAGHALVAWLLEHTDALLKVTIKPTTRGALGFAQYTPTEHKNFGKEQLFEMMCTLLGGRAAENIIFNRVTTGAQNDLDKVTKTAYAQIRQFGMSENVGLVSFTEEETGLHTKKPYSKKLANLMDAEARRMVAMSYQAAEKLLKDHRDKLVLVAEALLKQETLTYEEVENLIGPPPFGQKKKVDFIDIELPTMGESVQSEIQPAPPSNDSNTQ